MKRSTHKTLPDKTLIKKTTLLISFLNLDVYVFIHIFVKLTIYIYKLNNLFITIF